ncbi:MAG: alpha/beta hydrolase [Planctomycetota bacterium]|nr:alpha/beta hydrolase [Planctomycetota bacterium]
MKRSLRRRILRWTTRLAAALLIVLVALLAAGFAWDQIASRGFESKHPAPGRKVALPDGRNLHFVIKGEGEPTLVLEAGAGGPHTDWGLVIDELAEATRVIAYDRAGYGWSDPSPGSGSAAITADLSDGLAALGVNGPIVLVGHSIGGPYIRQYASKHMDQVAGLVFIDSSHEDQVNRMPPPMVEMMRTMTAVVQAAAFASRFGLLRALDALGANPFAMEDMPQERRAMSLRSSTTRAYAREIGGIESTLAETRSTPTTYDNLPILVLSATAQDASEAPPAIREHFDEFKAAWSEMQAELARLSSNSRHVPVPDAGHYIQFDRPDVVIEEIKGMVEAIRNGAPLSPGG